MRCYISKLHRFALILPLLYTVPVCGQGIQTRSVEEFRDQYLSAILDGDQQRAEQLVRDNIGHADYLGGTLNDQGLRAKDSGNYETARRLLMISLELARHLGNKVQEGVVLNNIGLVYQNASNYQEALSFYQDGLRVASEVRHKFGIGRSENNIGMIFLLTADYQRALGHFQEALRISREIVDKEGEKQSTNNIGMVRSKTGHYLEALSYFEAALKISETMGWGRDGQYLDNIGVIHGRLGDFRKALKYLEEALKNRTDVAGAAQSLDHIGGIYHQTANYPRALRHFQEAVRIRREIEDTAGEAQSLRGIGLTYDDMGDYQKALSNYDVALKISREVGETAEVVQCLVAIAAIYSSMGDYQKALSYIRDSLKISREIGDQAAEGTSLNNLGAVYRDTGNYQRALDYFHESLKIKEGTGAMMGKAAILSNIAGIHHLAEDYATALNYYQQALKISRETGGRDSERIVIGNIGAIYHSIPDYQSALNYYLEALRITRTIGVKPHEGMILNNIGHVYQLTGDYPTALSYYQQALKISSELGEAAARLGILGNIGYVHEKMKEPGKAVAWYKQAIDLLEEVRSKAGKSEVKEGVVAHHLQSMDLYRRTVGVLLQLDSPEEAFTYAERGKARGLLELLSGAEAEIMAGISPQLLKQKNELSNRIVSIETNLRKQRAQLEELRDPDLIKKLQENLDYLETEESTVLERIIEQHPRYAELMSPKPITHSEVQQDLLREDELLLEYVATDNMTAVFLISKEHFKAVPLDISRQQLREKVDQLRVMLSNPRDFDQTVAYDLYTKLLQPLETYFPSANVIYVVPDAALYYLPFEALTTSDGPQSSLPNFLLAKRKHITYVQSASILRVARKKVEERRDRPPKQKPIVVFADPVYSQGDQLPRNPNRSNIYETIRGQSDNCSAPRFDRLSYTADEAEGLAAIYKIDKLGDDFNLRDKASETRVRSLDLSHYQYLHFATHGVLCDETKGPWMQSSLVFSLNGETEEGQEQGNDGFLQMSEVFNLTLQADLVTLSACQTGLGRNVLGEGLVGLTRAFMYAGTPSVVVSLWKVSDPSTAEFMKQFYRFLNKGMNKAEALQETKLWMLEKSYHTDEYGNVTRHDHPFYWAPFILMGEYK